MPVIGTDLVIKNIQSFGGGFTKHVNNVMEKVKEMLDKEVTKNISLQDHSLEDLRKLRHPYAKSHLGWAKNISDLGHEHWWQVHKQSGQMLSSKTSDVIPARFRYGQFRASAYVAMSEDLEYNAYVIFGTSKMIPRDFLTGSLNAIKKAAYKVIRDNLRDAVTEFEVKHY